MSFVNPLLGIGSYQSLLIGITNSNYVGEDVRYSSNFEEIEATLASANSLFGSTVVDWAKVTELSEKVLTAQSKDLRVLSWFTWGLFKAESFAGLHAGLHLYNEIIVKCWDNIFPLKEKTKVSAIEWLATKLEALFQESIAIKDQLPLFKGLLAELKQLDKFLTEKWADNSPLLLPTCRRLERMITEATLVVESEPKVGTVEKVISQVKEVVSSAIGNNSAAGLENEREASKLLRNLQDNSRALCSWWLSQRSTDVKALRLNRTLLWISIETIPEHKDNITALRPVPVDKINNYKERLGQERYSDLIVDIENSVARAPFWLDGQHIVWQCLHALRMEVAMHEIEIQLALFLKRLPNIIDLKFFDGTAFACEDTISWINSHVLPWVGQQNNKVNPNIIIGAKEAQKWDEVLQECIDSLPKDGFKASFKLLIEGLKTATNAREKFFWQLAMAKLCLTNKRYELAKTQLQNLDEQIQQLGIDQWEPELALEVVYLLYRCCEALPQAQQVREEKESLYKRLCFLDINLILDEN